MGFGSDCQGCWGHDRRSNRDKNAPVARIALRISVHRLRDLVSMQQQIAQPEFSHRSSHYLPLLRTVIGVSRVAINPTSRFQKFY